MENSNETSLNLMDLFHLLMKNISKIIIVGVIMAVVAFGYTKTMVTPMYRSSAKMVIKVLSAESLTTFNDVQIAIGLVNDCVEIICSRQVMQEIIDDLDLPYTTEQLLSQISISVPEDTRVLKISVTNPDPELAKEIVSAICGAAESQVANYVGVDSIKTFEKATIPTSPVSPNVVNNTVIGGFCGMFAVAAILVLMKIINNKMYTQEDIEHMLGISVFSSIPYVDENADKKRKKNDDSKEGGDK